MAVLLLVGEGREDEEVVSKLLDVEGIPCKPAYNMVSDLPLNLFSTEFPGIAMGLRYTGPEESMIVPAGSGLAGS